MALNRFVADDIEVYKILESVPIEKAKPPYGHEGYSRMSPTGKVEQVGPKGTRPVSEIAEEAEKNAIVEAIKLNPKLGEVIIDVIRGIPEEALIKKFPDVSASIISTVSGVAPTDLAEALEKWAQHDQKESILVPPKNYFPKDDMSKAGLPKQRTHKRTSKLGKPFMAGKRQESQDDLYAITPKGIQAEKYKTYTPVFVDRKTGKQDSADYQVSLKPSEVLAKQQEQSTAKTAVMFKESKLPPRTGRPEQEKQPTRSPWGQIDGIDKIADGVWSVSTPGHGGIMVGKVATKNLTPLARGKAIQYGGCYCYEEDADWAIPYLQLDLAKDTKTKEQVIDSLSSWNPDILLEAGIEPNPERYAQYLARKKEDEMRERKDPDLIVSASRDEKDEELVKVWTADDKRYLVKNYNREKPLLSNTEVVREITNEAE